MERQLSPRPQSPHPFAALVRREFGFATHSDASCTSRFAAVIGPFDDPVAFVFGQCTQERDDAALVHTFDDVHAVKHAAGRAIPFGDDEDVAHPKLVDRFFKFRPTLHVLARGFLPEDLMHRCAQGADLSIQVLARR